MPSESPTSRQSTPAASSSRAVVKSYAVRTLIFRPCCFQRAKSGSVTGGLFLLSAAIRDPFPWGSFRQRSERRADPQGRCSGAGSLPARPDGRVARTQVARDPGIGDKTSPRGPGRTRPGRAANPRPSAAPHSPAARRAADAVELQATAPPVRRVEQRLGGDDQVSRGDQRPDGAGRLGERCPLGGRPPGAAAWSSEMPDQGQSHAGRQRRPRGRPGASARGRLRPPPAEPAPASSTHGAASPASNARTASAAHSPDPPQPIAPAQAPERQEQPQRREGADEPGSGRHPAAFRLETAPRESGPGARWPHCRPRPASLPLPGARSPRGRTSSSAGTTRPSASTELRTAVEAGGSSRPAATGDRPTRSSVPGRSRAARSPAPARRSLRPPRARPSSAGLRPACRASGHRAGRPARSGASAGKTANAATASSAVRLPSRLRTSPKRPQAASVVASAETSRPAGSSASPVSRRRPTTAVA